MPHFGKIYRALGLLSLLAAFSLSSCAHREKTPMTALPAEPVPGTHVLNPAKARGVTPVSLEAPLIATTEPYHNSFEEPRPRPTKAEQIASLVNNGTLLESKRDVMIFARTKSTKKPPSSLYADAILLGKVRRNLAEARMPGDFPLIVTVSDAVACLKLEAERDAQTSAKAIDAALRTPGIAAVEIRLVSSARL